MLAKKLRLPVGVFPARADTFYQGQCFTLKTSPNKFSHNRVGVIITKKTALKAVERNRLRRKVFDLFREETRLRFGKGTDLLVIVKPIKLDADAEKKLLEELNFALDKAEKEIS